MDALLIMGIVLLVVGVLWSGISAYFNKDKKPEMRYNNNGRLVPARSYGDLIIMMIKLLMVVVGIVFIAAKVK